MKIENVHQMSSKIFFFFFSTDETQLVLEDGRKSPFPFRKGAVYLGDSGRQTSEGKRRFSSLLRRCDGPAIKINIA